MQTLAESFEVVGFLDHRFHGNAFNYNELIENQKNQACRHLIERLLRGPAFIDLEVKEKDEPNDKITFIQYSHPFTICQREFTDSEGKLICEMSIDYEVHEMKKVSYSGIIREGDGDIQIGL